MDISRFTEKHCREHLLPFTLTRHTADIRVGMNTIKEKWEAAELKFPGLQLPAIIPADIIPGNSLFSLLCELSWEEALAHTDTYRVLEFPWQISLYNDWALKQDFILATTNKTTATISSTVKRIGKGEVFFEDGVVAEHCYINTSAGPVYVSAGAEIMEGSMLRGPLFIGNSSIIKMGAAIYGATSIGPHCVVGGEIKNSVFFGYSNKAHEGYLGDSVIGEWCNMGAGTTCSNLRNTASAVKVWRMDKNAFGEAGLKCGVLMGDYSRCSINSSFNTGNCGRCFGKYFSAWLTASKIYSQFFLGPRSRSKVYI
jgi:UDP-N-acetylglucosamine diphosphorylase/glucosamine-1-phosphate N-acetyltransferase